MLPFIVHSVIHVHVCTGMLAEFMYVCRQLSTLWTNILHWMDQLLFTWQKIE